MVFRYKKNINYKSLKLSVKRIFEQAKEDTPYPNNFDEWKQRIDHLWNYERQSSFQALTIILQTKSCVIKDVKPSANVIPNPFEKGLAVTINLRVRHSRFKPLVADDYQAPVFKIIHIFRESLMRHARVFVTGCFEVDGNGLLHVHFILDGWKLRNLSEKEVYAYHSAIKFIAGRVLGRDDVLVKEVRNNGFFEYLLKTVNDAETSERFFKYFILRTRSKKCDLKICKKHYRSFDHANSNNQRNRRVSAYWSQHSL